MRRKIIVLIFFISYLPHSFTQTTDLLWAIGIGGSGTDDVSNTVIDDSGNVYITGGFQGIADFNPNADTIYLTSQGFFDFFFAKYDANGNFIWAKSIGSSTGSDLAYNISIDKSGNIYLTGHFQGTADFDPNIGNESLTATGICDIFFAKYDSNGNYIWAKSIATNSYGYGNGITVDSIGNVYVIGSFRSISDFDPSNDTVCLTPFGVYDIFFAKYDPSGNYVWAKNIGSVHNDYGKSIIVDNTDNIYITGSFEDTADFDPGHGTLILIPVDSSDIFFAKYDNNGNIIWAKNIGSTNDDIGYSITVDSSKNVYLTGEFQGPADFDPGTGTATLLSNGTDDIFFAKYNSQGDYIWAHSIGSAGVDRSYYITIDSQDYLFITGTFEGSADFDPSSASAIFTPVGNNDIFIAKYDQSGNYSWAKNFGSTEWDMGRSISVDNSCNIILCGSFQGLTEFSSGNGTEFLNSVGSSDIFIAKFNQRTAIYTYNDLLQNYFFIFPNPATNAIQITTPKKSEINILNIEGQILKSFISFNNITTIDISDLSRGMYFITVKTKDGISTQKFIKD